MLRLADKWVWDFWFADRGAERHVFYLQAPRSLGDPSLRHHHATIGHAVSHGANVWEVLPDALGPGPAGAWDDLATWTGSAIDHDGLWYMLYTGVSREEGGLVQRVGLAASDDLVNWHKPLQNPVLEADARWYDVAAGGRSADQAWRDPWVFRCEQDGLFHVLVTARSRVGELDGAGVVGHARSANLVDWEVLPPVTEPGEFAQLEVPQLVQAGQGFLILFSCHSEDHSRRRRARLGSPGRGGTFAMWARDFSGPWLPSDSPIGASGGRAVALYAGKLIEGHEGDWEFVASGGDNDHNFTGELMGPLPAVVTSDGVLSISLAQGVP